MKNKPLPNQEYLNSILSYDKDTGVLTWKERNFKSALANGWNKRYAGKKLTTVSSEGYIFVTIDSSKYLAHRIIWKMITGNDVLIVDHINRNRIDNRLCNLREASTSLSMHNKKHKSCRLPQGVQPNGQRFMARISHKCKTIHLGTYATPEEASEVYCLVADMIYTPPTSALSDTGPY
jgi:hypothetical protein